MSPIKNSFRKIPFVTHRYGMYPVLYNSLPKKYLSLLPDKKGGNNKRVTRGACMRKAGLILPLLPYEALFQSGARHSRVSEPVFVNLLRSPGIDSQSGGPVR
jgi:hypothetical protein